MMYAFSIPLILSTFAIIFIAELPDKTALASLALGARYKTSQVFIGTWLALLVQTLVAILAGSLLTALPAFWVHLASGIGFLAFAYVALTRKEDEEQKEEKDAVKEEARTRYAGWIASFLVVFAAEWGDLTQLATAALVARSGNWLSVGIGALAALWIVSGLAIVLGAQLTRFINLKRVTFLSGILFGVVGIALIVSAFGWF